MESQTTAVETGSIDDLLFRPLADFVGQFKPDVDEFTRYLWQSGCPIFKNYGNSLGFVFELYLKAALEKFTKQANGVIWPSKLSEGFYKDGLLVKRDKWNRILVLKNCGSEPITEFDSVAEFGTEQRPIIFEAKANPQAKSGAQLKKK